MARATHLLALKIIFYSVSLAAMFQDYSLANATGLFNIHTMDWDDQALSVAKVRRDQLPELVDTSYQLTGLNANYAAVTGIDDQTPFILGASDGTLTAIWVSVPLVRCPCSDDWDLRRSAGCDGQTCCRSHKGVCSRITSRLISGSLGVPLNGGIVFRWVRDQLLLRKS